MGVIGDGVIGDEGDWGMGPLFIRRLAVEKIWGMHRECTAADLIPTRESLVFRRHFWSKKCAPQIRFHNLPNLDTYHPTFLPRALPL